MSGRSSEVALRTVPHARAVGGISGGSEAENRAGKASGEISDSGFMDAPPKGVDVEGCRDFDKAPDAKM